MDYLAKEEIVERIFEKIKRLIVPSESNNYKSRFLQSNFLLYCVVLLLVMKLGTILISFNLPQNIFFADITKSALENFVNQTRQSTGLNALAENPKLNQAAQLKAENMVQNQYFDHTSPSGISPWFWFVQAGYNYKYAGENLAIGFFDSKEVYDAWLNSPSHRANIISPNYSEVGTAVLSGFGPNNSVVVVQEFGTQLPVKQVAVKNSNAKPVAIKTNTNPVPTPVPAPTPTPAPAPTSAPVKVVEPAPASSTGEKVLSQETKAQTILAPASGKPAGRTFPGIINQILYNSNALVQNVIYGVSLIVIGILLALIFFNFRINFKKELVFRAVVIVLLLSTATLLNKDMIISLIPHKILI